MALEDREPSFEDKWRRRIEAGIATVLCMAALMVLQWRYLSRNPWIGLGFAPIVHYGALQLVSRITTGRGFGFRLNPMATRSEEVLDLCFTVAFLFTLLSGCYAVLDAAEPPPPPPVVR